MTGLSVERKVVEVSCVGEGDVFSELTFVDIEGVKLRNEFVDKFLSIADSYKEGEELVGLAGFVDCGSPDASLKTSGINDGNIVEVF